MVVTSLAVGLHGEHRAGLDGVAVEPHGARAAVGGVASDVVPVSPSCSRRKWTSSVRGSTSGGAFDAVDGEGDSSSHRRSFRFVRVSGGGHIPFRQGTQGSAPSTLRGHGGLQSTRRPHDGRRTTSPLPGGGSKARPNRRTRPAGSGPKGRRRVPFGIAFWIAMALLARRQLDHLVALRPAAAAADRLLHLLHQPGQGRQRRPDQRHRPDRRRATFKAVDGAARRAPPTARTPASRPRSRPSSTTIR